MRKLLYFLIPVILLAGCGKEFLDKKNNQKLLVPSSVEELQLLLDNYSVMNKGPGLGMIAADDIHVSSDGFHKGYMTPNEKAAYLRDFSKMQPIYNPDWQVSYQQIFYSNIVLDGLEKLNLKTNEGKEVRGAALFYRSYAYFSLLQLFAPRYEKSSAMNKMAVPFSLSADVEAKRDVISLQLAYERIIADLIEASNSLANLQNIKSRPSKLAALSLLGRVYLIMGEYNKAENILKQALEIRDELLNYNSFSTDLKRSFPAEYPDGPGNVEIIFYRSFITYPTLYMSFPQNRVNPLIFKLYGENDLRKSLYFQDNGDDVIYFKGSYSGNLRTTELFSGLTTDENYLNYAESLVRNNKVSEARLVMNKLLANRYKDGIYHSIENLEKDAFLMFILNERHKSLFGRETRWYDIRRFVNDKTHFISATKILDNVSYEISFGDEDLKFPFPMDE